MVASYVRKGRVVGFRVLITMITMMIAMSQRMVAQSWASMISRKRRRHDDLFCCDCDDCVRCAPRWLEDPSMVVNVCVISHRNRKIVFIAMFIGWFNQLGCQPTCKPKNSSSATRVWR